MNLRIDFSLAQAHASTSLQPTYIHSFLMEPVLFYLYVARALGNPRKEKPVRFTTDLHFP